MFKKLLCFLGRHNYSFMVWQAHGGIVFGDKCKCCGKWSKDTIKKSLDSFH